MKLLTVENAKTVKGEKIGWLTGILYLAPGNISGYQVCPHSDAACRATCLYTAGRGAFSNVQQARIKKTKMLHEHTLDFHKQLHKDIDALVKKAKRLGLKPAVRLNGTSDMPWTWSDTSGVMDPHPEVQFYDYTADIKRVMTCKPANYHLTFSRKSHNDYECRKALENGINVAVVFDKVPVGKKMWGYKIIDGDLSDLRFLDVKKGRKPVIVGLKAKGKARQHMSAFTIRTDVLPK